MSVSAGGQKSYADLDAIVRGGDAFMARVKALQQAKAEHDDALANLRLGHDVVRAMQDVQVREQASMDVAETAKAEGVRIAGEAKAEAERIVAEANDNAAQIIAKATADAHKLSAEVDEAHAALDAWRDKVKADVVRIAGVREAFAVLYEKIVSVTECLDRQ